MKFEVFSDGSGAFCADEAEQKVACEVRDGMEAFSKGRLGKKRLAAQLERCIGTTPSVLEAYEMLASLHVLDCKPERAIKLVRKAIAGANALLPPGFKGRIPWQQEGNRVYLMLMRTIVSCLSATRKHQEAVQYAAQMMALDPDDGACVRFTAGHEACRAGEIEQARHLFRDYGHEYPPFWYELGLTLLNERQLVPAVTAFRRGIAANPYIALVLFNGQPPNAFPVAHINWWEGPEAAVNYLGAYGGLWQDMEEAQRFLYWVFNNSRVMMERAALMACKEARPFRETPDLDAEALAREAELVDAIDDSLSSAIVRQRDTPLGPIWPWDTYEGA